ncbi:MAG: hypothetical protein AAFU03_03870, partial [Bacteroidota bacterium]
MRYHPKNTHQYPTMRYLFFALLSVFATSCLMSQSYDTDWKKVDDLQNKGKYRSALELVESIYERADQEKQTDQELKALFHRAAFTQQLEEDGLIAMIRLLQDELAQEKGEQLGVRHYVLGRAYYAFAQQQSYRNDQTETKVEEKPDQPLEEWSQERLIRAGTDHLLKSLEVARENSVALNDVPAIIAPGENLSYETPTLYDLLVREVLNNLGNGYAYLTEPTYAWRPTAEELFLPVDDFVNLRVDTRDTTGQNYRSLKIYQDLIARHRIGTRPNATFVYANLRRLEWAYRLTNDLEAYYKALQTFYKLERSAPNSGDILLSIAGLIEGHATLGADGDEELERKNYVRALELAKQVIKTYPNTQAGQRAQDMVDRL